MSCTITTHHTEETTELGKKVASLLRASDVIAIEGNLGSGKTTFAKGLALGLGVKDEVVSPTFTIIKEYMGKVPFYHMDVYRLETSGEELGLEEYFYGNGICMVEWPSRIQSLLPEETIYLNFLIEDKGIRHIEIVPPASRTEFCRRLMD